MQEDEEGYRLLLDEKKDKRLVFLLQQTDEYVASLTGLVKQHQAKEKMKKQQEKKDEKQALKQAFNDQEGEIHVIVRNTTTGEIIKGEEAPKADEIDAWLEAHPGFEVISRDAASDSEDDNDDDYLQRRLPEPKEDEYEGMDEEQKNKMIIEKARNEEDEYDTKTKNQLESYYATAHRIKEKIVKQHSTLGGGDPNLNLKPYQLKGLEWMVSLYNNNLNGILADEMGLGKTIQTVGLITYLMEVKKVNGPYLIVVPLSTISNWVLEFDKWAPHIVKIVYKGTKDMRKRLDMQVKRGAFNVLLTTYDYVMREKSVLGKIRWKYMIIDEGHRMKNHNCKLTITLNAFFHAQHRILLTGTPLQNKLPELWALLNFLLPSIFSSCGTFDQWFNAPFATTGEKVELNQEETMLIIRRLHKVLRPFLLRRLKKEVESELPEKTEYVIKCEQSALQKILYKHMEKGLLLDSKRKEAATSLNNTMAHLRKLCNHPFLFVNVEQECKAFWKTDVVGGKDLYRVAGKFELLDRILPKLKANGHRILIFSQSTELMHILEDYFFYRQWKYLRLDGSTNADKRAELMHTFNEPGSDIFIFMLSTRAGGLGLNLQAADTVIIFDSDWNPHQDMQAQDRAHRIGQQREVRVLRLITVNSIEEKILAAARFKLNIDEKVIQAGKFDQRTTDAERRRILEEIITKEEDNDEDEIPDDDAVNQMIARSEEEFEMFQNMDIERRRQEAAEYRRKPRLVEVDEIPPSLLEASRKFEAKEEEVPDKDLAEKISGDVRRARKKVNYSQDLIDDEEWIRQNLGESGDEDEDERKKNKKGKDKTPGKRGRKKRVIVDEDEEEENDDDGPSEKKKKRSSGEGYQQLEDHLNNMWKQLSEFKKSDGNILCEMFMQLPSKKELPLYYKTISKPIDLSKIKKFIRDGKYLSVEDLTEDIKLMVRNAQDYNEEGSEIYDDSVLINEVWNRLVQMMPFKASSTTPADTPGTSTSTIKARERTPAEGKERTPAKGSKESSKEPSKERSIEIDK
uniref:Uncharacterized protein n=1 Tax=Acrobeloides nanus TaxID=290746 RepID=A0A914EBK5_9BILA